MHVVRRLGQLPSFEDVLGYAAGQVTSGGVDFSDGINFDVDFNALVSDIDWEQAATGAAEYGLNQAINEVQTGSASPGVSYSPLPTAPPSQTAAAISLNKPIVPPQYAPPPPGLPPPPRPPQLPPQLATPVMALKAPAKTPMWPLFVGALLAGAAFVLS